MNPELNNFNTFNKVKNKWMLGLHPEKTSWAINSENFIICAQKVFVQANLESHYIDGVTSGGYKRYWSLVGYGYVVFKDNGVVLSDKWEEFDLNNIRNSDIIIKKDNIEIFNSIKRNIL